MRDWLVAADDRTGAFEVAGLLAAVVGPVRVTAGEPPVGNGVVDLGSRALEGADAAARAAAVEHSPSSWSAHKIDSTLRGNWAGELLARQAISGRRIVVLPGWPELGRTCVDGVVRVHGQAVGRPAEQLPDADNLARAAALQEWLAGERLVAVCDVPDTESMVALAAALRGVDVIIAGPSGPIGAAFAAQHRQLARPPVVPGLGGALAVVCGSANPVSHEQLRRLSIARPDIAIISVPPTNGELQPEVARELAAQAAIRVAAVQPDTLVVIGGDTTAALLGDAPRSIGGFVAAGMPWSLDDAGGGPLVVTKAGGFGGPDALVDLLRGENVAMGKP